jgi:hypothetical protein
MTLEKKMTRSLQQLGEERTLEKIVGNGLRSLSWVFSGELDDLLLRTSGSKTSMYMRKYKKGEKKGYLSIYLYLGKKPNDKRNCCCCFHCSQIPKCCETVFGTCKKTKRES